MAEAETVHVEHPQAGHQHAAGAARRHGPPTGFIRKYVFSIDHKVIGIQYLLLALFSVVLGMIMSVLMRMKMTWPNHAWPILESIFGKDAAPGGVMTPEFYLSLVTMHGTMMV